MTKGNREDEKRRLAGMLELAVFPAVAFETELDLIVCTIEGGVYSGKHVFQTKAESALKECSE